MKFFGMNDYSESIGAEAAGQKTASSFAQFWPQYQDAQSMQKMQQKTRAYIALKAPSMTKSEPVVNEL